METSEAHGLVVNDESISQQERNHLVSFRDAIAYATRGRHIQQFINMHQRAGDWAFEKNLQPHNKWLEDQDGTDPYGMFSPSSDIWEQAITWLGGQGWKPGVAGATQLILGRLLGPGDKGGEEFDNASGQAALPHDLLDPMRHHGVEKQSLIVQRILAGLDKAHASGIPSALAMTFLDIIPNEVISGVDRHMSISTKTLAGAFEQAIVKADVASLCTSTPPISIGRTARRI